MNIQDQNVFDAQNSAVYITTEGLYPRFFSRSYSTVQISTVFHREFSDPLILHGNA